MNTVASLFLVAICISGALANPVAPKEDSVETRTIYNSGGGIYLGLNSTLVWLAVFGLGALALLAYAGLSTGLLDDGASQQRYDQYHQQQEQPFRTKRSFDESKSRSNSNLNMLHATFSHRAILCYNFLHNMIMLHGLYETQITIQHRYNLYDQIRS